MKTSICTVIGIMVPGSASCASTITCVTSLDTVANTLRVQVQFQDLSGTNTASHVHCCLAVPFTGTAGVAATTPTFPGFPPGVTSGRYPAKPIQRNLSSGTCPAEPMTIP
jgi:hypothetical protein